MWMIETSIGNSTRDEIFVRGRNLVTELIGEVDFTEMALLQIGGAMPSKQEKRIANAILVLLSDHGITPSVIAARTTYAGAPESLQGSIASGLLGAGNRLLGTSQNTADMLKAAIQASPKGDATELAVKIVSDYQQRRELIPGFGHPVHTNGDPRAARIFEIAEDCGFRGRHIELITAIEKTASASRGKFIPINAAGAVGAVVADVGWSPMMARSLALIARTAGLLAHIAEEAENPQGMKIWDLVVKNTAAPK
jgi:citrate synthase